MPDDIRTPMIIRSASRGGVLRTCDALLDLFDIAPEELAARALIEWIHPEDRPALQSVLEAGAGTCHARHRCRNDEWVELAWHIRTTPDDVVALGRQGATLSRTPSRSIGFTPDDSASTRETLDAMVHFIESNHEGMKCSVLLLDESGEAVSVGSGPSLPDSYNAAVEGLAIGPSVGSCGTAAYWNVPVIVEDIQADPLWRNLKEQAGKAGLASCWSHPITTGDGEVLGALALYGSEPGAPTDAELRGLRVAAGMVALELQRSRAQTALRRSEAAAKIQARLLREVSTVLTTYLDSDDWDVSSAQLARAAADITNSPWGGVAVLDGDVLTIRQSCDFASPDPASAGPDADSDRRYSDVLTQIVSEKTTIFRNGPSGSAADNILAAPVCRAGNVVAALIVSGGEAYDATDGERLQVLCEAASVVFDSLERKRSQEALEERLRQAAKMDAVGVLAGGLAHDFNNMQVAILGNTELALTQLEESSELRPLLESVVTASHQATDLCNQMLAYAGRGVVSTELFECNEAIREMGSLLQVATSKKTDIDYQLSPQPLYVNCNKTQIRQVIMNLITNAADAIGDRSGSIVISTTGRDDSESELRELHLRAGSGAGSYVAITVADTGSGMDQHIKDRIFDPFYTTKAKGKGLGLAAAQGIVRAHGGTIKVESEVGVGTTFTVILPQAIAGRNTSGRAEAADDGGKPHVLLVDDERSVRSVNTKILQQAGFVVHQAKDGLHALEVFRQHQSDIDCVLLDLSMPRLDGEETFIELRKIDPDVRVIINSGFTEQEMLDRFKDMGFAGFLQKPTPLKSLVRKVMAVTANAPRRKTRASREHDAGDDA